MANNKLSVKYVWYIFDYIKVMWDCARKSSVLYPMKLTSIIDFKVNPGKNLRTSQRLWTGSIQRTRTRTPIQKLCTLSIECCSLISATHYTSRCKSKVKT